MATLEFGTKAGTLELLRHQLSSAQIAPLRFFTTAQWRSEPEFHIGKIASECGTNSLIVRSSCSGEDTAKQSNAGAFLSLPNVTYSGLTDAVDRVIQSYGLASETDEVLIQPMLQNVVRSGVAFSHDPNTRAPYRVINWSESDDTFAVTGGYSEARTWQQAAKSSLPVPPHLVGIVNLLDELLEKFGGRPIDCEFAVTLEGNNEKLWLLQVRPLIIESSVESDEVQATRLKIIEEKLATAMGPHPFLKGKKTVFGVMPDWNPAEIIGVRPKPLALSLYRELITDAIWAYQRNNYGYRNLRSFPLMPHFFGLPYIDVRLSFNSFIPADLDDDLAGRLVDHYVDRLLAEPKLHDKVEFEIVFSCYSLDLPERLNALAQCGFSKSECSSISDSLRRLTNRILNKNNGLWQVDAAKLNTLNARRDELLGSRADSIERIYWLLEDAKRYGTLPFAGLARAGFIAIQILKSFVAVGVFSQHDYDEFLGSVSTVSGQLARDRSILDRSTFLSRYGHLRPGTYDILSPRYDEAPELYFDFSKPAQKPHETRPFSLTLPQMRSIAELLETHGLETDPVGLFEFLQSAIELRELAKFHFSRNLSDALSLINKVGGQLGFSTEDLAYCDIHAFQEMYIAANEPRRLLANSIEQGKNRYAETLRLSLPPLIAKPSDVWAFEWPETEPNYITQKQVTAAVCSSNDREHLAGAIVCIPNADPGFDWLFAHPIAGLITAWGGANSHMAIRAGELGLPAVIGAGEILYKKWSTARRLHIDCAGRRLEVLA